MKVVFYNLPCAYRRVGWWLIVLVTGGCCMLGNVVRAAGIVKDTTAKGMVTLAAPLDVKPLQVGDRVPDMEFQMMNYTSPTARLSDFKGKLVILDFWATWCGACVGNFPTMEKIQAMFPDNVQVLLVNSRITGDNVTKIEGLLEKWEKKTGKGLTIPTTVEDTIAFNLSPHRAIPHYVWISAQGTVIGITNSQAVTIANIQKILAGINPGFPIKDDTIATDFDIAFITKEKLTNGKTISELKQGFIPGIFPIDEIKPDNHNPKLYKGVRYINQDISTIMSFGYPEMRKFPKVRVIIETKNPEIFDYKGAVDTIPFVNAYTYEFLADQPVDIDVIRDSVKIKIANVLNCKGTIEKRKMDCYLLEKDRNRNKQINLGNIIPKNVELGDYVGEKGLVDGLNDLLDRPVVAYNLSTSDDIFKFPVFNTDLNLMKMLLNYYGFKLVKSQEVIDVFVISFDKYSNIN